MPTVESGAWKRSLQRFFDERGESVSAEPTFEELCLISGRDPRVWSDSTLLGELFDHIVACIGTSGSSAVIEVGCAAGFLARGIAPRMKTYVGVDLAEAPLKVARRLKLPNARFITGDGENLDFPDNSFDAALSYDVFTNFPDFNDGAVLIEEMLRIVRPGGRVLIGSIPDAAMKMEFEQKIPLVSQDLERRLGKMPELAAPRPNKLLSYLKWFGRAEQPRGEIICYYFSKSDFIDLAQRLGVNIQIAPIHPGHPYAAYRFHAIFMKS